MNNEIIPFNRGLKKNARKPVGCWFCLDLTPDGPVCNECQMNLDGFRSFLSDYEGKYLVVSEDPNA